MVKLYKIIVILINQLLWIANRIRTRTRTQTRTRTRSQSRLHRIGHAVLANVSILAARWAKHAIFAML